MGEMADFALEDVAVMEDLRDKYMNSQMSDDEAYEHGIIDEQGYHNLSSDRLLPFTDEDMTREVLRLEKLLEATGDEQKRAASIKKYHTKWSMLRGMMQSCLAGRQLTDKQKTWLETNITFPVKDFPKVCQTNEKFRAKIEHYWKLTSGQAV